MAESWTEPITTRLRPALVEEIREAAADDGCSRSEWIARAVRLALQHRRTPVGPKPDPFRHV